MHTDFHCLRGSFTLLPSLFLWAPGNRKLRHEDIEILNYFHWKVMKYLRTWNYSTRRPRNSLRTIIGIQCTIGTGVHCPLQVNELHTSIVSLNKDFWILSQILVPHLYWGLWVWVMACHACMGTRPVPAPPIIKHILSSQMDPWIEE